LPSLLDFFSKYAAHKNAVAVRYRRGYRMESWSYGRIAQEANRLARELEARNICKGDSVLLWGENSPEWIIAFFACLLRGAVIVPLDHASTAEFVSRVAKEVHAKSIFRSRSQPQCAPLVPSIILESLPELSARHDSSLYRGPALSDQDPLEIIFTSGTTADPRGVVISHGNVLANIAPLEREIAKYLKYERLVHPLRFLNLLPLSHVFGQMLGIFIPPLLAGTVVYINSQKPSEMIEVLHRERVSVLVAVPRIIESLRREILRQLERDRRTEEFNERFARSQGEHFLERWWRFRRIHSLFGWKFWAIISGGAALPEQDETFWNRLGYAVIQGYGMTETTSLISLNHPFRSAQGSIGKVFPGMEVRVDEHGEILVRGDNVAKAYRQNDEEKTLVETDGWFHTGDLAESDESGRLYFKGRKKNVIVTPAGMNVYPEDLEKALRGEPGVRDCVVIGIARDGNAEACAVLLLDNSFPEKDDSRVSAAAIVEHANRSLAEYQKIRQWFIWPEPDFPRTPTFKPMLARIREVVNAKFSTTPAAQTSGGALTDLIAQITGRSINLGSPDVASDSRGPSVDARGAGLDSRDARLDADLHMSSLDRVELMSALEDRYQTDLSEVRFGEAATVGQIEKLITASRAAPVVQSYPTWPQNWLVTVFRLVVYYLLSWPATYLLAAPRVRDRENLRGLTGPVLVVCNHVTYLDIAWILPALPWRLRNRLATAINGETLAAMRRPPGTLNFFARGLERLKYFLALALFNVFPLPKQAGFLKSFSFAGDLADRGWNILIFPEGQTTADGNMVPFRAGIGLLAKQLNLPTVPMRIKGLFALKQETEHLASAWSRFWVRVWARIWRRPQRVDVVLGEPVRFSPEQDADEITRELERRVAEL
jgi:long-chain acyl-CoA synthetase